MSNLVPFPDSETPAVTLGRTLAIAQRKEWGEILTGWDTRNRYQITDLDQEQTLWAGEVNGSFLSRGLLSGKRPFTIEVRDEAGELALKLVRPWRWFFSYAEVFDRDERLIGSIQQRFSVLRRKYDIRDPGGQVIATLFGPLFRPWTFHIRQHDADVGTIRKRWSGILKEAFSAADNFGIEMGPEIAASSRPLFLAATLLIDFVHFEDSEGFTAFLPV